MGGRDALPVGQLPVLGRLDSRLGQAMEAFPQARRATITIFSCSVQAYGQPAVLHARHGVTASEEDGIGSDSSPQAPARLRTTCVSAKRSSVVLLQVSVDRNWVYGKHKITWVRSLISCFTRRRHGVLPEIPGRFQGTVWQRPLAPQRTRYPTKRQTAE